jgi:hypothetical protein
MQLWDRQPVVILAFVQAAIVLAVSFGADITEAQTAAVIVFATAALALVAWTQVTPVAAPDLGAIADDGEEG